ncbi:hypothetical protein ACIUZJ_29900 [Pseudomonas aeruginosa]
MHTTPQTPADLSATFQEQHDKFTEARRAYVEIQDTYRATVQETNRLIQAAQALEAEAEQANASWKEMAKARHADQRKINQEVERSVQLKMEAEKYRRTASVREELHGEIVVQIARARSVVSAACTGLRGRYREERIAALLATEGLGDVLRELRDLGGEDFTNLVGKAASQAAAIPAPLLDGIHVPPTISGEIVPQNGMEMARLEQSGGKSVRHPNNQ